jgi:ABC-type oligopeptide transport system, periplasmic component
VLLAAGCSENQRAELVVANTSEPETLDPALITAQADGRIASALFEGLLARDPKGNLVPGVAERWEVSDDGLTYRFYLRDNARWSDGRRVVAQDFLESWRGTELEFVIMVIAVSCVKLLSAHNSTQHTSRKHKV